MWWKGIIWPPTSSSWKAIPRAACLSGLITGSLLKIPRCSLLNPPSGRAPAQLFFPWRQPGLPAQLWAGIAQEHLLFGAFWIFLLWKLPWWKGRAAPQSSSISRQFMAPLSGPLPPAELCRWTWPSISFGQGKKEHYWKGLTFPSPCSVVMVLL